MCLLSNLKLVFLILLIHHGQLGQTEEDRNYWESLAKIDINAALNLKPIENIAKNVIIFVGDGMGLTTTTSARIYAKSESGFLAWEKFPHIGTIKTYNADKYVPDSCSTATALFCGVKANSKTSGVTPAVQLDNCSASVRQENALDSIFDWALEKKKATGFVTTTRVTHATPSALYAHTPNRNWECEDKIPAESRTECKDIARQLIEDYPGRDINVIMGGGRQMLVSDATGDDSDPLDTWSCYSKDGRNLIEDWQNYNVKNNRKYALVQNNEELDNFDTSVDYVMGIFANGHLKMDHARDSSPKGMPSLSQMTSKALDVLKTKANGYVLMVEGGMIDFGHHRGHARQALDETAAFSEAVQVALNRTNPQETLIIVASDHAHSMVFSGYADRGADILDIAQKSKYDQIPYTSLLYSTGGPDNYQNEVGPDGKVRRKDPSLENTKLFDYSQQAAVLTDEVTHSGSDVLVYAYGPWAHLFTSVHEQTYVAYVISYAAKIGPLSEFNKGSDADNASFSAILIISLVATLVAL